MSNLSICNEKCTLDIHEMRSFGTLHLRHEFVQKVLSSHFIIHNWTDLIIFYKIKFYHWITLMMYLTIRKLLENLYYVQPALWLWWFINVRSLSVQSFRQTATVNYVFSTVVKIKLHYVHYFTLYATWPITVPLGLEHQSKSIPVYYSIMKHVSITEKAFLYHKRRESCS